MTLSERAWRHIRERHPEVSHYEELIKDALAKPEILKGKREEKKAVKHVAGTHLGPKHLVVVYREERAQKLIINRLFHFRFEENQG